MEKSRDNSIDILRMAAAFLVILTHTLGSYNIMIINGKLPASFSMMLLMSLADCGVTVFFLISGAFVLRNDENASFRYFYSHIARTIAIPTIIFSIWYLIYSLIPAIVRNDTGKIWYVLSETIKGRPYFHMWYLYTLLCLYLFVPAIVRLKIMVGEKTFSRIAVLIFISSAVSDMTSTHMFQYDPGSAYRYAGYLFAGYLAYENSEKNTKKAAAILSVWVIAELAAAGVYAVSYDAAFNVHVLNAVDRILSVTAPVLLFWGFAHIRVRHRVKIVYLSFLIYLLHAGIIDMFSRIFEKLGIGEKILFILPAPANVLLITALIYLTSAIAAFVYDKIQVRAEKRFGVRQKLYDMMNSVFRVFFSIQ